jgi:Uma2 family endonuclease
MTPTATKLITAKEFAAMPDRPDGSKQELVRGVIVTMPPPYFSHGNCQGNVGFLLETYTRQVKKGRVTLGTGVVTERNPDTVRGFDVAHWSYERLPPDQIPQGYPEIAPDLAVEVLSPSDKPSQISAKIREYFCVNVCMVWIIDPKERTATVYRGPGNGYVLWDDATLTVEDLLPGFSCPVAEFFAP